jgi:hypothetical protein
MERFLNCGLRRVSVSVAHGLGKSPSRWRSPWPSSGPTESVHPKSEIVPGTRARQLAERYATPLPQLTDEVAAFAARVDAHLKKMGAQS